MDIVVIILNAHNLIQIEAFNCGETFIDGVDSNEFLVVINHEKAANDCVGIIIVVEQLFSSSDEPHRIFGFNFKCLLRGD